jgi:hypothetical protein
MVQYIFTQQEILERLSRNCPRAISTYILCLNGQDDKGNVSFTRDDIEKRCSESYTIFKNNLKALARQNLLMWDEWEDVITISLAELEDYE